MDKILRMRVAAIAREVRDWVEMEDNKREFPSGNLNGWCAIASAQLSRRLVEEEIAHRICLCEDRIGCHAFIVVDDHVVCVTATQFMHYHATPVVIAHEREVADKWYFRVSREFRTADELRRFQRKSGWPIEQTVFAR